METWIVNDTAAGSSLRDCLERRWPDVDRGFLRRLIETGQVTVNRMGATLRLRLRSGDEVRVDLPAAVPTRRQAAPAAPAVLAENELVVVIDKPAGIPSVADRAGKHPGAVGMVAAMRPDDDLRVAHRLDRDTSGCLALARGLAGARYLDEAFRSGTVGKRYLALVEGELRRERVDVNRHLGPDPRRPGKVAVVAGGSRDARAAQSRVEVVERFAGFTLVEVRPTTGRSHQIRVHLTSLGHPIVADRDYGSRGPLLLSALKSGYKLRRGVNERPILRRMFLHAKTLELPASGSIAELRAEAPLPEDLGVALDKVRRFAPLDRRGAACD